MKKKLLLLFVLLSIGTALWAYAPLDKSTVNALDRALMSRYNATLDKTATIIDIALIAAPSLTAFSGRGTNRDDGGDVRRDIRPGLGR